MTTDDAKWLSDAFRAIGWSKPAETFQTYVGEEVAGKRWTRVAELRGQMAGYVTVVWDSEDPALRKKGVPEIVDLNVLPEFRNRGIGGALLDEAEMEVSKRSEMVGIRVGLHKGYGAAQRMYVRRGYVPDGSGVSVRGRNPEEGSTIRLDDGATLRMTKRFRAPKRAQPEE